MHYHLTQIHLQQNRLIKSSDSSRMSDEVAHARRSLDWRTFCVTRRTLVRALFVLVAAHSFIVNARSSDIVRSSLVHYHRALQQQLHCTTHFRNEPDVANWLLRRSHVWEAPRSIPSGIYFFLPQCHFFNRKNTWHQRESNQRPAPRRMVRERALTTQSPIFELLRSSNNLFSSLRFVVRRSLLFGCTSLYCVVFSIFTLLYHSFY